MIDNDLCLFRRQILQKHPLFQKLRQLPHYPSRSKVRQYSQLCQGFQFPDITGEFASCDNGDREYPTGAFYDFWDYGNTIVIGRGCEDLRFGMKASNSNAVYSNPTVQPPACQTLIIIRT